MDFDTLIVFIPACFALNMTFGPSNLLALTNGAREGVGKAATAALGRMVAYASLIAITGIGLGALLAASALAFAIVKWAGAAYLVYLGIRLLRSHTAVSEDGAATIAHRPLSSLTRQEFLVGIGNPKAIVIFTAFFPQFVDPDRYLASFAVLGALFLVFEMCAVALYALAGRHLGRLANHPKAAQWLNRTSGSMMIGFGLLLAFARRPAV
ncbi:MAG: lysine transporter LysE [Ahrensia sp.]|nr:lysine transporter LysE [Ahrensia sp.]|tara:strand:+ start:66771 stop:67400 length:630 start_codon:yes stop_codon:yes gene_type:complete